MRFFTVVAALAAGAAAATIDVIVGFENQLVFKPEIVKADAGDVVTFTFVSKNHTVTQSTFANPCTRMTTPAPGIDSGYLPAAANPGSFPQYSFTVVDPSAPAWFYCAQGTHCVNGMVFAVNPSAERTFAAFKATAQGQPAPTTNTTGDAAGATPGNSASSLSMRAMTTLSMVGLVVGLVL